MTDTLRIGAIRAACDAQTEAAFDDKPSGRCAYPACEAKGQRCKLRAVGVDATIAFIAAWVLEPAQVEIVKQSMNKQLKRPGLVFTDDARAAITALFEQTKTTEADALAMTALNESPDYEPPAKRGFKR